MIRTISNFLGIAPRIRKAAEGQDTYAKTAQDIDLSGDTLRPFPGDEQIATGHTGEIVYFGKYPNGAWVSGGENYLQWELNSVPALFYKRQGVWRRKIGATEYELGFPRPAAPTLQDYSLPMAGEFTLSIVSGTDQGSAIPPGSYKYLVTLSRTVDGVVTEGPPRETVVSLSEPGYVTVQRPTIPSSADATEWNLYRFSDGMSEPKLVQSAEVTNASIRDNRPPALLGRPLSENRGFEDKSLTFEYAITWERNNGGLLSESGPSLTGTGGLKITVDGFGVKVTRPSVVPSGVINWNIYRISTGYDPTVAFQLVAKVPILTTTFVDSIPNTRLGARMPAFYTTASGVPVVWGPPTVVFDGMYGPYYGMLVGWKDGTLYFSDVGVPDAWPEAFKIVAAANIVGVGASNGELAVVTTAGVQRISGSDPLNMQLTPPLNDYGGISRRLVTDFHGGTVYVSRNHILITSGGESKSFTDAQLGKDFMEELDLTNAFIAHNDQVIYLFHAGGYLAYDTKFERFTTGSLVYTSAYRLNEVGSLCVLRGGAIKKLGSDLDNRIPLTYETGNIVVSEPDLKRFRNFTLYGSGQFEATAYIDGVELSTKSIDLRSTALSRDSVISLPRLAKGRAASLKLVGSGEITEIQVSIYDASAGAGAPKDE